MALRADLESLTGTVTKQYEVPPSGAVVLTNGGIPLDEVEDLLLDSEAYRQASRFLLPRQRDVRGRPLTPLHGGHVGLLCTAGMLNGVFGSHPVCALFRRQGGTAHLIWNELSYSTQRYHFQHLSVTLDPT